MPRRKTHTWCSALRVQFGSSPPLLGYMSNVMLLLVQATRSSGSEVALRSWNSYRGVLECTTPGCRSIPLYQSDRVVKFIFGRCKLLAKTEFRSCRPLTVMGFRIFSISTKKFLIVLHQGNGPEKHVDTDLQ